MTTTTSPETWITVRTWTPNTGPNFAGLAGFMTHCDPECSEIRKGRKAPGANGSVGPLCSKCFGGKRIELRQERRFGWVEIMPLVDAFDGEVFGVKFAVVADLPGSFRGSERFSDLDAAKAKANEAFRLAREAGWVRS